MGGYTSYIVHAPFVYRHVLTNTDGVYVYIFIPKQTHVSMIVNSGFCGKNALKNRCAGELVMNLFSIRLMHMYIHMGTYTF